MEEVLGGSPAASHKHPAISPKLFLIIHSQVDLEALLLSQGSSELLRQGQDPQGSPPQRTKRSIMLA